MTGVEWVSVPSRADHLMFLPDAESKASGSPCSAETMLRDQACPHWGWSDARTAEPRIPRRKHERRSTPEESSKFRNPKEFRNPNVQIRRPKKPVRPQCALFIEKKLKLLARKTPDFSASSKMTRRAVASVSPAGWCNHNCSRPKARFHS